MLGWTEMQDSLSLPLQSPLSLAGAAILFPSTAGIAQALLCTGFSDWNQTLARCAFSFCISLIASLGVLFLCWYVCCCCFSSFAGLALTAPEAACPCANTG